MGYGASWHRSADWSKPCLDRTPQPSGGYGALWHQSAGVQASPSQDPPTFMVLQCLMASSYWFAKSGLGRECLTDNTLCPIPVPHGIEVAGGPGLA
jgi:hypothetical protein